jgi:hypothetical protein
MPDLVSHQSQVVLQPRCQARPTMAAHPHRPDLKATRTVTTARRVVRAEP